MGQAGHGLQPVQGQEGEVGDEVADLDNFHRRADKPLLLHSPHSPPSSWWNDKLCRAVEIPRQVGSCVVFSLETKVLVGDTMGKLILPQELHTILAVACSGMVSNCRTGSMISMDWVRDPVEYKVRAAFPLVEER